MRILFCDWTSFADIDIVQALHRIGNDIVLTQVKPENVEHFDQAFGNEIQNAQPDAVFTLNFSPPVAECCHKVGVKYISWVYDNPQMLLYQNAIRYETNYVFLFDSAQYYDLLKYGVETVYYLPLAVDVDRIDGLIGARQQVPQYNCDVAFVGSLYNEEHNLYDRMQPRLGEYDQGYLEALMKAQSEVYGCFLMEEVLAHSEVLNRMRQAMPFSGDTDSFASDAYIYSNYFLGRKLTSMQRIEILSELGKHYQVNAYTGGDTAQMPGVRNCGCVEYFDEMPFAFYNAKINLNISLCSIQNGIPLRCFDILGSGGFLLTNYQADFEGQFCAGEDYVYYESKQDLYEKVAYYLVHEEERAAIARHGHDTAKAMHTYTIRLRQMMEIVNGA